MIPLKTLELERRLDDMGNFTEENMNAAFDDDEAYEALCAQLKPNDLYFHILTSNECGYDDEENISFIHIVPADIFDNDNVWDQHINLDHLLPEDKFDVSMEGVWESALPKDNVTTWLLNQGFRQHKGWSEIIIESVS